MDAPEDEATWGPPLNFETMANAREGFTCETHLQEGGEEGTDLRDVAYEQALCQRGAHGAAH